MNEKKLLRRADYWIREFADGIRHGYTLSDGTWRADSEPQKRLYWRLRKLAEQCRKAGRA